MPAALATLAKKKKRDAKGKFVDVETITQNTLTIAIQVRVDGDRGEAVAADPR